MRNKTIRFMQSTLLVTMAALAGNVFAKGAPACDRACLSGFVTSYLDALIAHDPSKLPTTRNVRFTENGIPMPIGLALWKTASGIGANRIPGA